MIVCNTVSYTNFRNFVMNNKMYLRRKLFTCCYVEKLLFVDKNVFDAIESVRLDSGSSILASKLQEK